MKNWWFVIISIFLLFIIIFLISKPKTTGEVTWPWQKKVIQSPTPTVTPCADINLSAGDPDSKCDIGYCDSKAFPDKKEGEIVVCKPKVNFRPTKCTCKLEKDICCLYGDGKEVYTTSRGTDTLMDHNCPETLEGKEFTSATYSMFLCDSDWRRKNAQCVNEITTAICKPFGLCIDYIQSVIGAIPLCPELLNLATIYCSPLCPIPIPTPTPEI